MEIGGDDFSAAMMDFKACLAGLGKEAHQQMGALLDQRLAGEVEPVLTHCDSGFDGLLNRVGARCSQGFVDMCKEQVGGGGNGLQMPVDILHEALNPQGAPGVRIFEGLGHLHLIFEE